MHQFHLKTPGGKVLEKVYTVCQNMERSLLRFQAFDGLRCVPVVAVIASKKIGRGFYTIDSQPGVFHDIIDCYFVRNIAADKNDFVAHVIKFCLNGDLGQGFRCSGFWCYKFIRARNQVVPSAANKV